MVGWGGAGRGAALRGVMGVGRGGGVDAPRPVTRRYTLDQAAEAYDALNRGEIVGRAIVTIR